MNLWTQRIRASTSNLQSQLHTAMSCFCIFHYRCHLTKNGDRDEPTPPFTLIVWIATDGMLDQIAFDVLLSVVLVVIMKIHFCWSTTHFYQHNLRTLRVYWLFVFILAWSNWTTFYLPTPTPFNSWVYYYLPPIKEAKLLYNFCQWTRTTTTIPG